MKLHRFAILALALVVSTLSVAATNNASFKGTYTLAVASMYRYSPEYNNKGQQVGFCTGQKIPNGYSCGAEVEQDVMTGTLVADGNGHVSGSFSMRSDPNSPHKSKSGRLAGSYAVQSNGSGVLSLTSNAISNGASFAILLGPNGAGQVVTLVALPAAGNGNRGAGTAIRQ